MAARQGYEFGPTGKAGSAAAAGGAGVGFAIVEILVYLVPYLEPVSAALNVLVGAGLAYGAAALATKFTPSASVRREQERAALDWENSEGRGAPTPVMAGPVATDPEPAPGDVAPATASVARSDAADALDRLAAGDPKHRA